MLRAVTAILAFAFFAGAQTQILPLREVRPGMKGTGRTVFSGDRVEEFGVEILGVLENTAPKQSIILGRLTGREAERAGVLQGMSGSPVYVQGRLIGAVSSAFAFAKEPVAGIRPIEEMLRGGGGERRIQARAAPDWNAGPEALLPAAVAREVALGGSKLSELACVLSLAGFSQRVVDHFLPQFRALGWEPRQGATGGGSATAAMGDRSRLRPGSMISVQLMRGDFTMGADGTVTHIDGNTLYAFGHRFLSIGSTELPFTRSEVITLLPNLSAGFKISASREPMGTITHDGAAAVKGELGRSARMVAVEARVEGAGGSEEYKIEIARDRLLTPFLTQVATYALLDASERTAGAATLRIRGRVEFEGGLPALDLDNVYAADTGAPLLASLSAALPLTYAAQTGFDGLTPRRVSLHIQAAERKHQWNVQELSASRDRVRPGGEVEFNAVLQSETGQRLARKLTWRVPVGAPAGPVSVVLSDANTAIFSDFAPALAQPPASAAAVVELLNALRPARKAYLRALYGRAGVVMNAQRMPSAPASLALLMKRWQSGLGAAVQAQSAAVEFEVDPGRGVVAGSKSISIEIKE
jgi:hypothetical protein